VYLGLKDAKAAEDQFEAALLLQSNSVEAQRGLEQAQNMQHSRNRSSGYFFAIVLSDFSKISLSTCPRIWTGCWIP